MGIKKFKNYLWYLNPQNVEAEFFKEEIKIDTSFLLGLTDREIWTHKTKSTKLEIIFPRD